MAAKPAEPSVVRAFLVTCLAVAIAVLICVLLPQDKSRYTAQKAALFECRTAAVSTSISSPVPGVCSGDLQCTEEDCCAGTWHEQLQPARHPTLEQLWGRWQANTTLTQGIDIVSIDCRVASIQFSLFNAKASCLIYFFGRFDNNGMFAPRPDRDKPAPANTSLMLSLGATAHELKANAVSYTRLDIDLILGGGWGYATPGSYPNMRVPFTLWFSAWWWDSGKGQPLASSPEPPVLLTFWYNDIHSFLVDEVGCGRNYTYSGGTTYYTLQGHVQLSPAAVRSVRDLNIAMWSLAGMTCALSLVWCMLGDPQKHLHVDIMCFSGTLLFALPTMRGMLPETPETGTQYDVLNIFGQLWLLAFSIFLQALKLLCGVVHSEYVRQHSIQELPLRVDKQVEEVDASRSSEEGGSLLSAWVHKATCS